MKIYIAGSMLIAGAVLSATAANAAPPKLSGAYILSGTRSCQAIIHVTPAATVVGGANGFAITDISTVNVVSDVQSTTATVLAPPENTNNQITAVTSVTPTSTTALTGPVSSQFLVSLQSENRVKTITVPTKGTIEEQIGTANFVGNKVTIQRTVVEGDAVSTTNITLATSQQSQSNLAVVRTATTVKIGADLFEAVYGNVDTGGVAQYVNLLRKETANCVYRMTLVRQ